MGRFVALFLLMASLAGCGGGVTDAAPAPVPGAVTVSGRVTFDKVPAVAGGPGMVQGLIYAQTAAAPARGVTVELLQNDAVTASTTTNATGAYSFANVAQNTDVSIRVRAEMLRVGVPSWDFRVVDNVNGEALYTLAGAVFNTGTADITRNLHAASGWTGAAYTTTRSAAPFAILDVAYDAVALVLTAAPATAFPALRFQWSTANVPTDGTGPGEIGSSKFQPGVGILLLGAADQDTDEYDRHVIAHEFGHYLEHRFSRLAGLGGPHALTDQLDMRLAFSEAWASAFAAMATGDSVYVDTHNANQARAFSFDLEQTNRRVNPNPGWFNEESLQALIFDLYDNGRDNGPGMPVGTVDNLELGFPPIWAAFTDEQRMTLALPSVFPFVHALKTVRPADVVLIDGLTSSQQIAAVTDVYGTGQTNFGIPTQRTPLEVSRDFSTVYDSIVVGATLENVCSLNDYTSALTGAENKLASRRFVRFAVTSPGPHTITVRAQAPLNAAADPDLVLHRGALQPLVSESAPSCTAATPDDCVETFSPTLQVGEHVLEIYEWTNTNALDDPEPPIGRTCFEVTVTQR
jgi:hypothetical protein